MQRPNLAELQSFVTVARERSFTRAAAQLGVSRSALSHSMLALESRLGIRLLSRTTRSVSLTEAGTRLLVAIEPHLTQIDTELSLLTELRDTPAGRVRISATDYVINNVLWPKLAPLARIYPDIELELSVDYGLTDIVEHQYDAGVRTGDQVAKDMIAVLLTGDRRLAVVASPEYLQGRPIPAEPGDLIQHRCLNLRLPTYGSLAPWELEKDGKIVTVRVGGAAVFNSVYPVLQAAIDAVGVGFVPLDLAQPHFDSGTLVPLLPDWWPMLPLYLYYPHRRQTSSAFAAVLDALKAATDEGSA
nr:LysR family transcriptional regulator [Caballeronia calidae]